MKNLTPYDLGTVLEPRVWAVPQIDTDDWGKVDFENDEGGTDATVRITPDQNGERILTVEIETNQRIVLQINGVRYASVPIDGA